jgi:TatD DNase family protein
MFLFDSHAHLNMEQYKGNLEAVISRALNNGVAYIINVGFDRKSSEESIKLAEKYDFIYAAIGFHPHDSKEITDEDLNWLESALSHEKVVAIGEIGLDFHYDNSPREIQKDIFIKQMDIAKKSNMPVIIHSRDASLETQKILFSYDIKTLLHCYSGSLEMAEEYINHGYFLALGGAVTFKNAKKAKKVAEKIDISHLLIETDCPYMAPVPYRGQINEPSYVKNVADEIAKLRGSDTEKIAEITYKNACEFFNIGEKNG